MSTLPPDDRRREEFEDENEEVRLAEAEAARVGGSVPGEGADPAWRAVVEGGGGEAEGFEQAESELIERASHGDEQSAHVVLHHQGQDEDIDDAGEFGEADHERSSETDRN
jgi:hypothetical protein